ncbi:MAG: hypothetical protein O3A00_28505, partial [Planctomycetota bacterium]|nr:hypothetical protein [Planctomycetota bacterium]
MLTTLASVDLNPLAAGMAETPETSAHTSVKARVEDCRTRGVLDDVGGVALAIVGDNVCHWQCFRRLTRGTGVETVDDEVEHCWMHWQSQWHTLPVLITSATPPIC